VKQLMNPKNTVLSCGPRVSVPVESSSYEPVLSKSTLPPLFANFDAAGTPDAAFAHTAGTGRANLFVIIFLNDHATTSRTSLNGSPLYSRAFLLDTDAAGANLHTHLGLSRRAQSKGSAREDQAGNGCAEQGFYHFRLHKTGIEEPTS
jgi:hypothetical protein